MSDIFFYFSHLCNSFFFVDSIAAVVVVDCSFPPSVSREVAEEAGIDFDDPIVEKNDSNTPLLFSDLDTDSNSEEAKLKRRVTIFLLCRFSISLNWYRYRIRT